jgi:hypothetical protein
VSPLSKESLGGSMQEKTVRRQFLAQLGRAAAFGPVIGSFLFQNACGGGSSTITPPPQGDGYPGTDDQLLDEIQQAAFLFFWEQADPNTGQVKDRALAAGNDSSTVSSIASTGFGLTSLCIGAQRSYQPASNILSRVQTTLNFLLNQMPEQNGFFYHFVDMSSGARAFNSEVSSIDTAILLCGVLTCRQSFQDAQVQNLASQIYERVNWPWMLNGGSTFSMGWTPEQGFISTRWDTYSELMMLYLLAMGSPTNPVPVSTWSAWARPSFTYQGLTYISSGAPLFTHQYSHAWFDFHNKKDAFADYFQNSITATTAHRLFCISLEPQFSDYGADLWGISSSDSRNGYVAWGGPPALGPIDGTVVPCATAGSLPFLYSQAIHVLRWIRGHYPQAWQRYGYVDAINPLTEWYDQDVVGIDVGITMLMVENYRTGFVWNAFMKNPEAQNAMQLAGFLPT